VLADAALQPRIIELMTRPAEAVMPWHAYRDHFLTAERIDAGVAFWAQHGESIARISRSTGVAPHVIVGIIGCETFFGRITGKFRVVDALSTLAFDYPPRANYFRAELEQFLLLAREAGVDVFSIKGSYAGAIGIPQFMPSSLRRYAVDFDRSGAIDLSRSTSDAVGSVANFLKVHGWVRDADAAVAARVSGEAWRALADGGIEPRHSLTALREAGVEFDSPQPPGAHAALIELSANAHRVALRNFYVITRYNRSNFYAAAVAELAGELRKGYDLGR
jgi:membrane-bound lytic murein transglycosylase B